MNSVMTREDILREKVEKVEEGKLVLTLFQVAERMGICSALELENRLSFQAMDYVYDSAGDNIREERLYTSIRNVYYVVELYLRGFYNKEHYIGYEEFFDLINNGKAKEVIEASHASFVLHINRLKKIIAKSKKKIPWDNEFYTETRELLKELDKDLSLCERYPNTSINLAEFYFGRYFGTCGPVMIMKNEGFLTLEKTVYSLYNELSILSKFDEKYKNAIFNDYIKNIGVLVPFNLFEKVVNNFLFASPYSDHPEKLKISKVEAELLMREMKMGTLNSTELINQLIDKYGFTGFNAEYLREYDRYTQRRIENLRKTNYFGELFVVTPPD